MPSEEARALVERIRAHRLRPSDPLPFKLRAETFLLFAEQDTPPELLDLLASALGLDGAIAEAHIVPPASASKPEAWARAVRAEALAQYRRGIFALFDDEPSPQEGFALSENRTAQVAGVQRYAARQWRRSSAYCEAVAAVVRHYEDEQRRDVERLAAEAATGTWDPNRLPDE